LPLQLASAVNADQIYLRGQLSLTPRFSGVLLAEMIDRNRFSGFQRASLGLKPEKPLKRLAIQSRA
jgi:hypothetical protein